MPAKGASTITYKNNVSVENAALYNCRRSDLALGSGIKRGEFIQGSHGYAVAEADVPGVEGPKVEFEANGRCSWRGKELKCMCLPGTPKGKDL
jgi:hypothetical protein